MWRNLYLFIYLFLTPQLGVSLRVTFLFLFWCALFVRNDIKKNSDLKQFFGTGENDVFP